MAAPRPLYGIEVKALASELKGALEGARLRKVYVAEGGEFIFSFQARGRKDLVVSLPGIAFLSSREFPIPRMPPPEASALRRRLSGAPFTGARSRGFERILEISLGSKRLVIELFHEGNIIVVSPDGLIEFALRSREFRHRVVAVGEEYVPPPASPLSQDLSRESIVAALEGAKDVVRGLARAGLGGLYAEETLARAGIEKETKPEDLSEGDIEEILESIRSLLREAEEPRGFLYLEGGRPKEYSYTMLRVLGPMEVVEAESFSRALEEAYASAEPISREVLELEERIRRHREQLEELRVEASQAKAVADEMASRAEELEALRKRIWGMFTSGMGVDAIAERVPSLVSLDPKKRLARISLPSGEASIRLDAGIWESIQEQYAKAKRLERRVKGLERVIEELISAPKVVEEKRVARRRRFWFESYRWFFSTEGFLVLGGKDAASNERLVKKHLGERDIYVHAQIHGAPSVVVKCEGRRPGEETLIQAGKFAVSYSRAWAAGWASAPAYWVEGWQVTKRAPSGEFLPRGAFMVYGRRNYLKGLPLELSVGIIEHRGVELPMAGPPEAVAARADRYVTIVPGGLDKERVARDIAKVLSLEPADILPLLPPGRSQVVREKSKYS